MPAATTSPSPDPIHVSLPELLALGAFARGASLATHQRHQSVRGGGHVSRWRGRGVDFRESRGYEPGDDIRHMDWRLTARSGKPHTKLFEEEREQGLLLAIDLNPGMRFGTRVRFKNVQAARAAAFLAWMTVAHGDRVGALGFGGGITGEVRPASGRRGVLRTLRALRDWDAAADPAHREPLSAALQRVRRLLRPGMRLVILSDGLATDAPSWPLLTQLAARHEILVVLLRDALELAPPPPGRYALSLDGTRSIVDFADPNVRDAWPRRFAEVRDTLRSQCVQRGIRVAELDTHADLRRALAPLLGGVRATRSGA